MLFLIKQCSKLYQTKLVQHQNVKPSSCDNLTSFVFSLDAYKETLLLSYPVRHDHFIIARFSSICHISVLLADKD